MAPWITDSVLPIVAAKREEVVKSDFAFSDILKLIPTPGHTIDHFSVQVGKPGNDAVITGDMIHSPLQARYPELGMRVDYNSPQAGESRRKLFGHLCDSSTLVCTAHFPSPSSGRIKRWGDGFKFEAVYGFIQNRFDAPATSPSLSYNVTAGVVRGSLQDLCIHSAAVFGDRPEVNVLPFRDGVIVLFRLGRGGFQRLAMLAHGTVPSGSFRHVLYQRPELLTCRPMLPVMPAKAGIHVFTQTGA